MDLNWSTFILEIINFLVLAWILKRFFYKPVMDVIARRKAVIEQSLADAEKRHGESEQLQKDYAARVAGWQQERQKAEEQLNLELHDIRQKKLTALEKLLDQEREKARVLDQHKEADRQRKLEEESLAQGARFAARLLSAVSGEETESRLVSQAIQQLNALTSVEIATLRETIAGLEFINVVTAYELDAGLRQELETALHRVWQECPVQYSQDRELIAGLLVSAGAWRLGLNVRDELNGFATLAAHGDE